MNAVDTNVLIYLHDTREPAKQAQAAALVSSLADGVLIWQVACEYIAAGRKLKHIGVPEREIWKNLRLIQCRKSSFSESHSVSQSEFAPPLAFAITHSG